MGNVVKMVNAIRPKAKTSQFFPRFVMKCLQIIKLCFYIVKFDGYVLEGKLWQKFFLLRTEIYEFLKFSSDERAVLFKNEVQIFKFCYIISIFIH